MTESLKDLLVDQLTDLHDSVVVHLDDHSAQEVLGEELDQLRGSGTGKSLVMLALMDDLLRMTEIVLADPLNPPPKLAAFVVPFLQSAAKTFAKKGLNQYARFTNLTAADAGSFLHFHQQSTRPFGGNHKATEWSGLKICTNVAGRFDHAAVLEGYEQLAKAHLGALLERRGRAPDAGVQQLAEFITDRCADVRDELQSRQNQRELKRSHSQQQQGELETLREELDAERARLHQIQTQLAEREALVQHEWKRFQQERGDFERLRQEWEERLADQTALAEEAERLANERETLAIESAALKNQRLQLDAALENNHPSATTQPNSPELLQEQERLVEERRQLESDRAALWEEREELAALREQWQAEREAWRSDHVAGIDHVLFEPEPSSTKSNAQAAVVTAADANDALRAAALAGDSAQVGIALQWGADVDCSTAENGWQTPLHLAARQGHASLVARLLDAGADALRTDGESLNPLQSAIINQQEETARLLAARVPEAAAQAFAILLRIVRDVKSPAISRRLSVEAIGHVKSAARDAIPSLLNLLESESLALGQAAAEALAEIDSASVSIQAIPYVSYVLDGPLAKSPSSDPEWVAQLHVVRGDLYRLIEQPAQALCDYEQALRLAPGESNPAWRLRADAARAVRQREAQENACVTKAGGAP